MGGRDPTCQRSSKATKSGNALMENGGKIEHSGPSDMACCPGYDNKADK